MKPEIQILKEIINIIESVYKDSGYMQFIIYAANDGKLNWYSRAKKLILESEK
jgi:hypothetical protein